MVNAIDSLQAQLDAFLAQVQRKTQVPGISAAISLEGKRIRSSAGVLALDRQQPMTQDTEFHLGCITKLILAIVILELARERILDLAIPIQEYLPELRGTVHGETVNLSHLLSHTSGYRGIDIYEHGVLALDWKELADWLRAAPQHFTPGAVFSYEHTEAVIAGEIIRRVTGKTALTHIREDIFEPLGVRLNGESEAAGQKAGQHVLDPVTRGFKQVRWAELAATMGAEAAPVWQSSFLQYSVSLESLLTIAEFIIGQAASVGAPTRCLPAATLSLLQRPAIAIPPMMSGPLAELMPVSFGLGACHWHDGFHGAGGATFGQCHGFRFDARSGAAVAVGINVLQPYLRDLVIGRICETLAGTNRHDVRTPAADFELRELAGDYRGPGSTCVTASFAGERLALVIASGSSPVKLRAELSQGPDHVLILNSPAPHLSIGFFREVDTDHIGMMVGNAAYKRAT